MKSFGQYRSSLKTVVVLDVSQETLATIGEHSGRSKVASLENVLEKKDLQRFYTPREVEDRMKRCVVAKSPGTFCITENVREASVCTRFA